MKSLVLVASFAVSASAFAAESWFDYPSNTYLRTMRPEITRLDLKRDVLIDPGVTRVTLLDSSRDDDGGYDDSGTRCDLVVTADAAFRRILANTQLHLRSAQTSGDTDVADESRRARLKLGLETAGGFPATLECSTWYVYEPSDPDDDWSEGSSFDQTPYSVNAVFRVLRKETIITAF